MRKMIYALALSSSLFVGFAQAAVINFSGQLDVIDIDLGGAIYSGTPLGTVFSGNIDDVTAFFRPTPTTTRIRAVRSVSR